MRKDATKMKIKPQRKVPSRSAQCLRRCQPDGKPKDLMQTFGSMRSFWGKQKELEKLMGETIKIVKIPKNPYYRTQTQNLFINRYEIIVLD